MARGINLTLTILVLIGLSSSAQAQNKAAAKSGPKLGLLIADLRHERWQTDVEQFTIRASELNATVLTRDAQSDPDTQFDQAKELLSKGVRVLVVNPVDGDTKPVAQTTVNNGTGEVPAVLLAPKAVDRSNLMQTVFADKFQNPSIVQKELTEQEWQTFAGQPVSTSGGK